MKGSFLLATIAVAVVAVAAENAPDARLFKVLSGGVQHVCFPGKGCDSDFNHDDCDKHCRNRTFLIGACQKIYAGETRFGAPTAGAFCCCFGIAGSPMAALPLANPSHCA
ncbi:hypothetical protein AAVH_07710 [Aphelenchoides avenae]|nr:hypothetical protein AAVH_07710 [Aphelenchus avenae]